MTEASASQDAIETRSTSYRLRWIAGLCGWALASYLLLALTPMRMRFFWLAQLPLLVGVCFAASRWSNRSLTRLCGLSVSGLIAFMLVDAVWVLQDASIPVDDPRDRLGDLNHWGGEVFPKKYYPTEFDFELHKPSVVMRSAHYGEAYQIDGQLLLEDSRARDALFEREVEYAIDEHGFRSSAPMEECEVFALGDSFTFANHVDAGEAWHALLGRRLGRPIYNLGVTNSSPGQHLKLVRHLLQTRAESFRPKEILWMLFEGNDLEDRYRKFRPRTQPVSTASKLDALPVLQKLLEIPSAVRASSAMYEALYFKPHNTILGEVQPQYVDGVSLVTRVYNSEKYGPRVFSIPRYIERATKSRQYVDDHPNRPYLEAALRDLQKLGRKHGFRLTILLAPSAPRVYGRFYEDMPQPTQRPHFLEYLTETTSQLGLECIDLLPEFEKHADRELLYFTDDSHWTPQGHGVVAEFLEAQLAKRL